ncbi:hypothetical protein EHQ16_17535 [Leptospira kanakyensis]|uniref:Uncharacterized protein n=1 Tax=Leptospira kanakyensis TaxID=2484968 RepID=A0A6N4Q5A8_9LEPT|nr:hypothetical protein [Leptospira kanakyensis]TGK53849.1 hypothetical protein EHQ11_05845 [Leptospira kanakyensis]TGK57644.1 hypothetical protein EHQ16_17535 [Leptospira kanakyensis]TGK73354.1 hypothetical protein EHQ18_05920 [Leptospira kanakyensis]
MNHPFTKNQTVIFSISLVISMIGFKLLFANFWNKNPSFEDLLRSTANDINRNCPQTVDKDTRLDNVAVFPNKRFQYNYSIIAYTASEIDIQILEKNLYPVILNTIKSSPDMKLFRENEVTLVYSYRDRMGNYVFSMEFKPSDYH